MAVLANGQLLIAGGMASWDIADGGNFLCTAEVLSPDGWVLTGSMSVPRARAVAASTESGFVIIAGGEKSEFEALCSAEIWDPGAGVWNSLPEMACARLAPAGVIMHRNGESERFVVLGGEDRFAHGRMDAEAFDLATGIWEPWAGCDTAIGPDGGAAVAVAGSLIVCGADAGQRTRLFDSDSKRWFTLAHQMSAQRQKTALVLLWQY